MFIRFRIRALFTIAAFLSASVGVASLPELEWERYNPDPFSFLIRSVDWNGSHFLVVGEAGLTAMSPDGDHWLPVVAAGFQQLEDTAWLDDGSWIAVGETIFMTSDGVNWVDRSPRENLGLHGVASDKSDRVVAVGESVWVSNDAGETWAEVPFNGPPLYDIVWTGDGFFAAGGVEEWQDLQGRVYFSADGESWALRHEVAGFVFNSITWTGSRLLVSGKNYDISRGTMIDYSDDGHEWNEAFRDPITRISKIRWAGDAVYAVGFRDDILRSTDGLIWTSEASGLFWIDAVGGHSEKVVASGLNVRDEFGVWSGRITSQMPYMADLATDGDVIVAASDGVWTSADGGITFNQTSSEIMNAIVYEDGLFIGADIPRAFVSADGLNWEIEETGGSRRAMAIAAHNGTVITVGRYGEILRRSPEGEWMVATDPSFDDFHGVGWAGGRWIAVGSGAFSSLNGTIWFPEDTGTKSWQSLQDVGAIGEIAIVVGDSGIVSVSEAKGEWHLVEGFSRDIDFYRITTYRGRAYITDRLGRLWSSWNGLHWREETRIPLASLTNLYTLNDRLFATGKSGNFLAGPLTPPAEPPQTYAEWIAANEDAFPENLRDPTDESGPLRVSNFLGYALGVVPAVASAEDLPHLRSESWGTELAIIFEYRRNRRAEGVVYRVLFSHDLSEWMEMPEADHRLVHIDEQHEIWHAILPSNAEQKTFFRLIVDESVVE